MSEVRLGSEGDALVALFDELLRSGDSDQRAKLGMEAMLFLSARIDRNEERLNEVCGFVEQLMKRMDSVEHCLRSLIRIFEASSGVTADLLVGAAWRKEGKQE